MAEIDVQVRLRILQISVGGLGAVAKGQSHLCLLHSHNCHMHVSIRKAMQTTQSSQSTGTGLPKQPAMQDQALAADVRPESEFLCYQ